MTRTEQQNIIFVSREDQLRDCITAQGVLGWRVVDVRTDGAGGYWCAFVRDEARTNGKTPGRPTGSAAA